MKKILVAGAPGCYLVQCLRKVKLLLKILLHCCKSDKKRLKKSNKTAFNLNFLFLFGIYFCWGCQQQAIIQSTHENYRKEDDLHSKENCAKTVPKVRAFSRISKEIKIMQKPFAEMQYT